MKTGWCRIALAIALLVPLGLEAQPYPDKPVRFIVPFTPGAINDLLARLIGAKLGDAWKQQVVVDNRAGAGTVIGTDLVAKSAPDGYTLLLVSTAFAINETLYPKLPYNAIKDFAPVTQIATAPARKSIERRAAWKPVRRRLASRVVYQYKDFNAPTNRAECGARKNNLKEWCQHYEEKSR